VFVVFFPFFTAPSDAPPEFFSVVVVVVSPFFARFAFGVAIVPRVAIYRVIHSSVHPSCLQKHGVNHES
jgi:uncharacterized membrane protein